ncbi:hypothetical protein CNEO4_930018 [Clostridium neonatale]|nr:hypothetical protein CNEO4_1000022 [Clostridium neonatale]CAI3664465.1 hypothetical protein CNEO3_450018 [Clostridium neonatale]CAI3722064.1 hypothetical protein CNEO4_990014 [Clostridium neonatale]CAI3726659.1 hypothetical protein CNEO4_930018 [Clostridium neonatale]CAI4142638.1 hypothetical protein CNEO4_980022 [Clostridium neonatale]
MVELNNLVIFSRLLFLNNFILVISFNHFIIKIKFQNQENILLLVLYIFKIYFFNTNEI